MTNDTTPAAAGATTSATATLPPPSAIDSAPPPPPPIAPPPVPHEFRPPRFPSGVRWMWRLLALVMVAGALFWVTVSIIDVLAHEERVETASHQAASLRALTIDSDTGWVTITGTDADEVVVRTTISEGLRQTTESQRVFGDTLELRARCPELMTAWCSVTYDVEVPRGLDVTVDLDDGRVTVTGVDGAVDVRSRNGGVHLDALTGALRAATDSGRIEASRLRTPTVEVDTDDGGIDLEFAAAPTAVTATGNNGSIEVVVPDDGSVYRVSLDTDRGDRRVAVPASDDADRSILLRTDNGDVTARTPGS